MTNDLEIPVGKPVEINYKARGCIVALGGFQLVVPLMGEGIILDESKTVFAAYKGDFLMNDASKVLIRLGDGRVVAILRSSIISIQQI